MLVKTEGATFNLPYFPDPDAEGALEVSEEASCAIRRIVQYVPREEACFVIRYILEAEDDGSHQIDIWQDAAKVYDAITANLHNRFIETYEDKVVMERNAPKPEPESIKGRDVFITLAPMDRYPQEVYADRNDVVGSYVRRTIK